MAEINQTIEERVLALENQAYVTYLQTNALIQELVARGVVEVESVITKMDEINKTLFDATKDAVEAVSELEEVEG